MPAPSNKSASAALPVGYRLGEYAIEAVLGQGGFGITYRARDTRLGAQVAIKEYFPQVYAVRTEKSTIVPGPGADLENYRWGLTEFLKEAQALAKFKHPHIVRVLRFLEANGTAYTIMEYEEGQTLSSYLAQHGGVLDEASLLRVFLPVLSGLEAVHEAGLLHLDIKPDNIYLRANEQPMLIDFGSSRQMRGEASQKITLTPGYCALEQYPGHGEVGPWSDVYGIGAALYRCMTGKGPVDALERHHTLARTHADALRPATAFERPFYATHIRQCVDAALKLAAPERPGSAFVLQQGLMGKDMAQVGKRRPDAVFRAGTGYIGAVLSAPVEEKKSRRPSRPLLERLIALTVVAATFAIITPMTLINLGRMTEAELYDWIEQTRIEAVARVRDAGDWIDEKVFGVKPLPKPTTVAAAPRAAPAPAEPVVAPEMLRPPFPLGEPPAIEIAVPGEPLHAIGFLQHGLVLATASDAGLVQLWDVQTGAVRTTLPAVAHGPGALGVFPSSQWLAAADRGSGIAVFDPLGNRDGLLPGEPDDRVAVIAVSAAGRLLAAAEDNGQLAVWELSQRRRLHELASGKSRPRLLAFSPDERLLLAGDDAGGIAAWDVADGVLVSYRRVHEKPVTAMAFTPDGRLLAVGAKDGTVRFWTAQDDAPGRVHIAGSSPVEHLSFSRDGLWLLAASDDGAIHVWNVDTGEPAGDATAGGGLRAFAATADGKLLAAAGDDNIVRIWK
ncbi:hypothetical protein SVA_1260 [Sulfurifustis variabilis]|uniref:Protein kinase domain-containing protein n=1 Tax=Sulfurifustis variabilis TaxID=1675686 RepID=A0A1B4V3A6_9GAMM|nr:serine/threonine-protein kinase [Sulfurifustis variabilis]BAU47835.1 hypothetical protein SVA_1260 [Sulfurifustis variabilis]